MCQACERTRHSVVTMAIFLRGPWDGWPSAASGAPTRPEPTAARNVRRETMTTLRPRTRRDNAATDPDGVSGPPSAASLAVSPEGVVGVSWLSMRTGGYRALFMASADGGAT